MSDRPAIALVSRELAPYGGGGIGEYVATMAALLGRLGQVTIFTSDMNAAAHRELLARGTALAVEVVFVQEAGPADVGGFYSPMHLYSARVWEALRDHFADTPPDFVEFSDYLAEGFVTTQAKNANDPWLRATTIAIRLHTSAELCAVLDGHFDDSLVSRITGELERFALAHADVLIAPGPATWQTYCDYYGSACLAAPAIARYPVTASTPRSMTAVQRPRGAPIRLLYLGRMERRKGVHHLISAVQSIDSDDWRLTMVGGDTQTGPLGTSVLDSLKASAAGDERVRFVSSVPLHELGDLIEAHDVIVLPSLWENWPYVGLRALMHNRPIVATPTGGFTEIVRPGESGWLTAGVGARDLQATLEHVIWARDELEEMTAAGRPREVALNISDDEEILAVYRGFLQRPAPAGAPSRPRDQGPLVSAVVPYFRLDRYLRATIESLVAQTHQPLEIIVVNDGSFREDDWVLAELAAQHPIYVISQPNAGLGAARNIGIRQSRGEYVLPLDADNMIEPDFVERCVRILEQDRALAFATSWSRYVDDAGEPLPAPNLGYQPIGNWSRHIDQDNVAGDAVAVLRRRIFDLGHWYDEELTSFEDWFLYRELHHAGRYGVVIPERLIRYRVRENSMIRETGLPQAGRLAGEMRARLLERKMTWTYKSD